MKLSLTHSNAEARHKAIYDWLTDIQLARVLDGGSAAVVAISPSGHEYDAYFDIDGLWVEAYESPGYVNTLGWTLDDLHY